MYITHQHKNQKGMLLVEVMFILVLVGLLLSGIIYFVNRAQHQQGAQRTAQEINIIFAAGLSYFADHQGKWPPSGSVEDALTKGPNPYLMRTDATNPWQQAYRIHLNGPVAPFDSEMEIGTCVPGDDTAYALAGILPYGQQYHKATPPAWLPCSGNWKPVTTRISTTTADRKLKFNFALYNLKTAHTQIPKPDCRPGETPQIVVVPVKYDTGGHPMTSVSAYAVNDDPPDQDNNWVVHIHVITDNTTILTETELNEPTVLAITDCRPPKT